MAKKPAMNITARVRESIVDGIRRKTYKPGDSLPGLRSLAATHQASAGSVRNALRDLIAKGVLETEHGKGTFIANTAALNQITGAKTDNILVIMPRTPAVDKLRSMALEHGLLMSYYRSAEDKQDPAVEQQLLEMAMENHYRGVILTPTPKQPTNKALFAKLRRSGTKVLLTGRYSERMTGEDTLLPEFQSAARVGVTRLALAGYQNVTCLDLSEDSPHIPLQLAYRGFREAVEELDLTAVSALFKTHSAPEAKHDFTESLEAVPSRTGVICYGEKTAQYLMEILQRIGRKVPEDVGVLCIDSIYGWKSDSEITRMKFDLEELTQRALNFLIDEERGAESVRTRYLRATFVQGATTMQGE